MRIKIEPLRDELLIAADLCEEVGDAICSHLLRSLTDAISELVQMKSDRPLVELALLHSSWNAFCEFKRSSIAPFLAEARHIAFLDKHGFKIASKVMAKLRRPLTECFETFLFHLLNDRIVTLPQVTDTMAFSKDTKNTIDDSLTRLGYATNIEIARAKSQFHGIEFVDLRKIEIPNQIIEMCSEQICRDYEAMPIREDFGALVFAVTNPLDADLEQALRFILNRDVKLIFGTRSLILLTINLSHGAYEINAMTTELLELDSISLDDAEDEPAETPTEEKEEIPPRQLLDPATQNQLTAFRRLWVPVKKKVS